MTRMGAAALCCLLCCAPLAGDDVERRIERLEANQQALGQQIEKLRAALLEAQVERKRQGADRPRIALDLRWRDGFHMKSRDDAFALQVGGYLQAEAQLGLSRDDPAIDTFRLGRTVLRTTGSLYHYWRWLIEVDFQDGAGILEDAWLELAYRPELRLMLGQFYRPFSQEVLTHNKYIKLIERSMASNFIPLRYDAGAMLYGQLFDGRLMYNLALQNGSGGNRVDENDGKDLVARLVLRPWAGSGNDWLEGLRFGGAVTTGDQGPVAARGIERGPTTAAGTPVYQYRPGLLRDGQRTRWNVQGAWHVGSFGVRAEAMQLAEQVRLGALGRRAVHTGWYVTLAWLVTGEKMGFGRVRPLRPFDPAREDSGLGAWELVARVGQIHTESGLRPLIEGALGATQVMAGINWCPNSMLRLSLDYQHAAFRDTVFDTRSEDSLLLRLQIEY